MQPEQLEWVTIAHLLRPQGRKGEVLAELHTDFPDQLTGREVFLRVASEEPRAAKIESHWLPTGRNAGRVVLKLAGIDSISDAEGVAGTDVVIPASARMPLEAGSFYTSDLIGSTVRDHGQVIGTIEEVQFPTGPDGSVRLEDAAPILVLRTTNDQEALIPFVQAYLKEFDPGAKQMELSLPPGLIEMNDLADDDE